MNKNKIIDDESGFSITKKRILVVDDEPDFVEMIKMRLEANNYSVVVVSCAKEIFQTAQSEIPDLILLDIVMPHMDGYQVCERLKEGEKTANIPIIFLTGKELEPKGITERCLKWGVRDFLLKPIDTKELLGKITKYLEGR